MNLFKSDAGLTEYLPYIIMRYFLKAGGGRYGRYSGVLNLPISKGKVR